MSLNEDGNPIHAKLTPVPAFTLTAIARWAHSCLSPGAQVLSDGLACFSALTAAGCQHHVIVVGARKPKELPEFEWVNTVTANVKTSLCGAYHAFNFAKYATRYLGAIAYRFNRRFDLRSLPRRLLAAAVKLGALPESRLRLAEDSC